jgi:hypothetical protein
VYSLRRTPLLSLTAVGLLALLLAGCSTGKSDPATPVQVDPPSASAEAADAPESGPEALASASVASVTPTELPVSGGERVTLEGTGLSDVTGVTVNGAPATELAVESDELVTFVSPRSADFQPVAATIEVQSGETAVPVSAPVSFTVQTPVDRQLSYALAHWNNYNLAAYGDMNPIGGDCVNFVSQTLIERGWKMTDEWHNRSAGADWTSAWIHVPTFERWLQANAESLGITPLTIDQRDQVKVGDIVVFDWNLNDSLDHTQIVSAVEVVDGKQRILMAGHNLDHNFRDLDNTITVEHPGAYAAFWSVP